MSGAGAVPPAPIDYRDLLVRYVAHVMDAEGCDFITDCGGLMPHRGSVPFTPREVAELERIAAEALPVYQSGGETPTREGAP